MPTEYWEYRLVDEHFKGNWLIYWQMLQYWVDMILGFRRAEGEASELQEKRWKREHGRPKHRPINSNRGR